MIAEQNVPETTVETKTRAVSRLANRFLAQNSLVHLEFGFGRVRVTRLRLGMMWLLLGLTVRTRRTLTVHQQSERDHGYTAWKAFMCLSCWIKVNMWPGNAVHLWQREESRRDMDSPDVICLLFCPADRELMFGSAPGVHTSLCICSHTESHASLRHSNTQTLAVQVLTAQTTSPDISLLCFLFNCHAKK